MADDLVWSFISYAHDDNLPTGGGQDEEGFVSFLQRMLDVKLKDLGAQQAKLWRDAKRFSDGDPYDVEIEDALKKSALLIVVMSRNWLSRPYCKKELDDFIRYRQGAGVSNVEERIVVVCKQYVPKESRPAPLQVQEGFAFYERDPQDYVAGEKPFFNLGKPTDDRQFFEVRDGLAILIQKRLSRINSGAETGTNFLSPRHDDRQAERQDGLSGKTRRGHGASLQPARPRAAGARLFRHPRRQLEHTEHRRGRLCRRRFGKVRALDPPRRRKRRVRPRR